MIALLFLLGCTTRLHLEPEAPLALESPVRPGVTAALERRLYKLGSGSVTPAGTGWDVRVWTRFKPEEVAASLTVYATIEFASVESVGSETPGARKLTCGGNETLSIGPTILDQAHVIDANVSNSLPPAPSPTVVLTFDDAGNAIFAGETERRIGERLAIVVNGACLSAPTIQSRIPGHAVITMAQGDAGTTEKAAYDLAEPLRAPLPVRLVVTSP